MASEWFFLSSPSAIASERLFLISREVDRPHWRLNRAAPRCLLSAKSLGSFCCVQRWFLNVASGDGQPPLLTTGTVALIKMDS